MPDEPQSLVMRTNPGRLERRLSSLVGRALASRSLRSGSRGLREVGRRVRRAPHRVEYFHQVADPYSHLAAQLLAPLAEAYDVELAPRLAGGPERIDASEPELLAIHARKDAADVAPHYGLSFPAEGPAPTAGDVALGERILAGAPRESFAARAVAVGRAVFAGDTAALREIEQSTGAASESEARRQVQEGTARRSKLGHYAGGMFWYAGEWYWGADRLAHLEHRLRGLGAARTAGSPLLVARPPVDAGPTADTGRIHLDFFPSLRSPYTAVIFDQVIDLARRSGVALELHPVLPMVMRGVSASFAKGRYIFTDARREADAQGVEFGRMVDPIGRPVERGFALLAFAREHQREVELLSSFLRLAWAEGVDTSSDAGLRRVVEAAGLDWSAAQPHLAADSWRDEIERNRLVLVNELGLWGVPSFRVRGPGSRPDFSTWGQDRLWLVAREIRERIGA